MSLFRLPILLLALLSLSFPCRAGERTDSSAVVMTVGPRSVTYAEFERHYAGNASADTRGTTREAYASVLADYLRKVLAAEAAGLDTVASLRSEVEVYALSRSLPLTDPDVGDFRDGLLVYEITQREVDIPSHADTAALNRYFLTRRDDFRWTSPRFKGRVVTAVSDSLADAAARWLTAAEIAPDSTSIALRRRFGPGVKVERILARQGASALVDSLVACGRASDPSGLWRAFRLLDGRFIAAPESVADVRGLVVEAYRRQLERQWIDSLRRRYPAVVLFD